MAARRHLLAVAAAQDVGHVRRAEALPDPRDTRQDLARQQHRLGDGFELAEAVVARLAGSARVASRRNIRRCGAWRQPTRGGVALHVAQQAAPLDAQLAVALEHHAPLQEISGRGDQHALGFEAIASGAAGFLLIVLERLRRAGMQHEADVRSIDAHAERDRGDDDVHVLVEERVLIAVPLVVREPGVVRPRRDGLLRAARPPARPPRDATGSR